MKSFPNTWYLYKRKERPMETGYVRGSATENGKKVKVLLHRLITNAPKGLVVDHINHDTLNNTRNNLRVVTYAQNSQNKSGASQNNMTGIRGVSYVERVNKWTARLTVEGKLMYFGYFDTPEAAGKRVEEAIKKYMPFAN